MKRAYVAPTVEKVEFQYEQSVVASGYGCHWEGKFGYLGTDCNKTPIPDTGDYVGLNG